MTTLDETPPGCEPPGTPADEPMDEAAGVPKQYAITAVRKKGQFRCWQVSMSRRGVHINRQFFPSRYGGVHEALQAAIAFRDQINSELPPLTKQEFCATIRSTNTSGVPGVYRLRGDGGRWAAIIHLADGRTRKQSFAIARYGEQEAFRLAVEARQRLLAETGGTLARDPELRRRHDDDLLPEPQVAIPALKTAPPDNPYAYEASCDVVGVHLAHKKGITAHGVHKVRVYWMAELRKPDGRYIRKGFPVERLGNEEAKRRAIDQRMAWNREYGIATRRRG